jgi:hypothetical protein
MMPTLAAVFSAAAIAISARGTVSCWRETRRAQAHVLRGKASGE